MRLPRSRFEWACRVAAFALLGWLFGTSVIPPTPRTVERASTSQIAARLPAWTRAAPGVALHGDLTTTPAPWVSDWLSALGHSGHIVTWSGSPPPVTITAEALSDPRGGARIDVAAPAGLAVALRDDASA